MSAENKSKDSNPFTKASHDQARRSLLKTLSWRALASIDTFLIAYLATGHVGTGAAIVSCEIFTKMALYYAHERGWAHIKFGAKQEISEQQHPAKAAARFPLQLVRRKAA